MKRTKAIYVTTRHNRIYHNIFEHLDDSIELINVITERNRNEYTSERYRNVTLPITNLDRFVSLLHHQMGLFSIRYTKELQKFIERERPDVVIANLLYAPSTWQVQGICRKLGIPFILQTEIKMKPLTRAERIAFSLLKGKLERIVQRSDLLAPWTQAGADFLKATFKADDSRIVALPPGIDTKTFRPGSRTATKSVRIIMIARFLTYKRHQDLITAAEQLKAQDIAFRISLLGEGPLKEEIKETVEKKGLDKYITFLEPVPNEDIPKLLRRHDLLVLPSVNEAIGIVVPEAMACGTIPLVSDTVGATTYINDGEDGLIFRTGDVNDLVAKIIAFHTSKNKETMRKKAEKKIAEQYSNEVVGKNYSQVIRKVARK